jgi:hypothetical protein
MNRSNSKHINDLSNTQPNQDPASSDSNTNVNRVWTGPKSVHSFRCSDKLWKAFVQETKAQGDSVCHVMEAIIAGVLGVLKEDVYKRSTVTIENFHVQRVVQKHRRVSHRYEPEPNFYDAEETAWRYIPNAVLNEFGHVRGCACKDCRRGALKNV